MADFCSASLRRTRLQRASNDGDPGRLGCRGRCSLERYCLLAYSWACVALKTRGLKTLRLKTRLSRPELAPPFPFTKTTFQWDYSCPAGIGCSFACPGGESSHVLKLSLYLGTVSFDGSENAPALFYEFVTREFPHASGFSISAKLSNLSCQINGMTLDYSGLPK